MLELDLRTAPIAAVVASDLSEGRRLDRVPPGRRGPRGHLVHLFEHVALAWAGVGFQVVVRIEDSDAARAILETPARSVPE